MELISEEFSSFLASNKPQVEGALKGHLPVSAAPGTELFNEAVRSAIFPGGKPQEPCEPADKDRSFEDVRTRRSNSSS